MSAGFITPASLLNNNLFIIITNELYNSYRMKSHQQIPQLLLKRFSHNVIVHYEGFTNKEKFVYYLDIRTFVLSEEKTRNFGAIINYYNDDTENYLSTDVEGPFSAVVNKVFNRNFTADSLDESDITSIKRFVLYSMLRRDEVIKRIMTSSISKVKKDLTIDDVIKSGIDSQSFFSNTIKIVRNKTNREFIVPYNCVTTIILSDGLYYFIPISPETGIAIKKSDDKQSNDIKIEEIIISDTIMIDSINLAAFDAENKNKGLIISRSEEELTILAKKIGKQIIKKEIA